MGSDWVAEKLAQLMPHGASGASGGGGYSNVSRTELAGYLQNVESLPSLLVWAQYINAEGVQGQLLYEAELRVADIAADRGWRPPRGKQLLRRMARLAVLELVEPLKCPSCRGTGANRLGRRCKLCRGSGNRKVTERQRARLLDVPQSTWERTWQRRYHRVLSHFESLTVEALHTIRDNMRA